MGQMDANLVHAPGVRLKLQQSPKRTLYHRTIHRFRRFCVGVVERDGPVGKAAVYVRAADGVGRREMFDSTPPVMPGLEVRHGFAFD